jgi:hypothetical protein
MDDDITAGIIPPPKGVTLLELPSILYPFGFGLLRVEFDVRPRP